MCWVSEPHTVNGRPVRKLRRSIVKERPCETWNAFLALMSHGPAEQFDDVQLAAYAALRYDGEVQNGGHCQFFVNGGGAWTDDLRTALETLGGGAQLEVLVEAIRRWSSRARALPVNLEEFAAMEREEELLDLDMRYYKLAPSTSDLLEKWAERHLAHFVEIVDDD